jgi:hypothetical protein
VLLLRRLLFVVLATFITSRVSRAFALFAASQLFWWLHVAVQPFAYQPANTVESLLQLLLTVLAASLLVDAQAVEDGRADDNDLMFWAKGLCQFCSRSLTSLGRFCWQDGSADALQLTSPLLPRMPTTAAMCSRCRKHRKTRTLREQHVYYAFIYNIA